jgi:hypothetical protein
VQIRALEVILQPGSDMSHPEMMSDHIKKNNIRSGEPNNTTNRSKIEIRPRCRAIKRLIVVWYAKFRTTS